MTYEKWQDMPTQEVAKTFAEDPGEIRELLADLDWYRADLSAWAISYELGLAVEKFGLDPAWIDYVEAHIEDMRNK